MLLLCMCSSNILIFFIIEKIRVEKKMFEILCDGIEIFDFLKIKKKGFWVIFLILLIVFVLFILKCLNNKFF